MAIENLQIYGEIQKFDMDGETLLVSGVASTPDKDKQGDIVTPDAMRKALGEYETHGTVREMHQPIAAGRFLAGSVDEMGVTRITVKVVDKNSILKVKEGVLKGFSIRGPVIARDGNKVTALELSEISLVDNPANPKCLFEVVKFDKPQDKCSDPECKHHVEGYAKKCASCMSKVTKSKDKLDDEPPPASPKEKVMKSILCKALNLPESTNEDDLQKALTTRLAIDPMAVFTAQISKLEGTVTDLMKAAQTDRDRASTAERQQIISKMDEEGRCPMKDGKLAYTLEEIQKMDIGLLKILAVNSPVLPREAKAVFKSLGNGPTIDPNLKGFDRVQASFEHSFKRN